MQINTKPIIIESLNTLTRYMPRGMIVGIERISEGIIDDPGQREEIEITYRDGVSERISVLEMSPEEMFIEICSMISIHAMRIGEEK